MSHWTRRHFLEGTSTRFPKDSWEVRDVVPKCRSKVSPAAAALPIVSLENGGGRGQLESTGLHDRVQERSARGLGSRLLCSPISGRPGTSQPTRTHLRIWPSTVSIKIPGQLQAQLPPLVRNSKEQVMLYGGPRRTRGINVPASLAVLSICPQSVSSGLTAGAQH